MTMPLHGLIPYFGGKKQIAETLGAALDKIPHTCYCEPFMGAAHVFFAKKPAKAEFLNDINDQLVNLFRMVKDHLPELQRVLEQELMGQTTLNRFEKLDPALLTDIQRAARFYYLKRCSFISNGKSFSINKNAQEKRIRLIEDSQIFRARLQYTQLLNLPWQKCMQRIDASHTLFYIDPPYYNHEKDYGEGIFSKADWPDLVDTLQKLKGGFVLSINDCEQTRALFAEFPQQTISKTYASRNKNYRVQELLVTSKGIQLEYYKPPIKPDKRTGKLLCPIGTSPSLKKAS